MDEDLINDPTVQSALQIEGYKFIRKLKSGEWAAIFKFLFTTGLVVGIDLGGYRTRYCYEHGYEALDALVQWDGYGDPPGPWIKEKGRDLNGKPIDRSRVPDQFSSRSI